MMIGRQSVTGSIISHDDSFYIHSEAIDTSYDCDLQVNGRILTSILILTTKLLEVRSINEREMVCDVTRRETSTQRNSIKSPTLDYWLEIRDTSRSISSCFWRQSNKYCSQLRRGGYKLHFWSQPVQQSINQGSARLLNTYPFILSLFM